MKQLQKYFTPNRWDTSPLQETQSIFAGFPDSLLISTCSYTPDCWLRGERWIWTKRHFYKLLLEKNKEDFVADIYAIFFAGFPSVGKSTLLTNLAGVYSEVAAYEFTTLTTVPGVIRYKGAKIQLLDLPGIIEGAKDGKGRGRQVIAGVLM